MRRLLLSLPILLMPLAAAGQVVANDQASRPLLLQQSDQFPATNPDSTNNGFSSGTGAAQQGASPLVLRPDAKSKTADTQYGLGPNLQAHASVSEHSWANGASTPRVVSSELGATYNVDRYSVGLSVSANGTPNSAALPRLLPGGALGNVNGLASFDSSAQLNARGRLALDSKSGIDLGASVGRVRLLPGNLLGISTLDQKALSFGVDRGPLSGAIIGRSLQPQAGIPGAYNPDRRWNSIDLGVTWRLPWQGELSIGAQNVWSSGNGVNTPTGPEPDQSRTPYVQYHQDL
ncbi:hypothetical protein [Dyella sp. GSA-30]|uniref:hypothetical protein n=1 Tax=Dyella sp. GSA-30 TaxID=2994496 RepID=UPI00249318E5|nr:hypothetical protein [Dyella sp. GSA-30]BDU20236.1 hypothetical protein DYGSA30_16930 [Dyella sp. GSA-30]